MRLSRVLFIHQNFPAQFVHVASELARLGHEVVAVAIKGRQITGVRLVRYAPKPLQKPSELDLGRDFETKLLRGLACADTLQQLRKSGFEPDTIIAHPGWGEALFCRDVWPRARLVVFPEFFYSADGADYNFDPEFAQDTLAHRMRLRLKNNVQLQALQAADAGYVPTEWQLSQMPPDYRHKLQVIFDGIDTRNVAPDPNAFVHLQRQNLRLTADDEVITFVNRNLEPYRGFHIFMRALPRILRERPHAHCLVIGRDGVSYGSPPSNGGSWREVLMKEVGNALPMDRVHFLGAVPYQDYLRVLQVSRCHVYLTYPFVLSWSCLEAMSAGCTVVASDTGPVREVIQHGRTGLLFDFFDVEGLTDQVISTLESPERVDMVRQRARQLVVDRFDLHQRCLPKQLSLILGESR